MSLYPEDDDSIKQDKINQEKNRLEAGDHSGARFSNIKSPEEEEKENKRNAVLNLVNDVNSQREDIDKLNQSMSYVAQSVNEIKAVMNQQTEVLNRLSNAPQAAGAPGVDPKAMLGDILNSPLGEKLINKLLPDENRGPAPIIDNSLIQDKMKQTFFDNLETGESINNFIKNSLKKSVTKSVINTSLKDIGQSNNTHAEHGPQ